MNFNKKLWNIVLKIYQTKKINKKVFFYLYKDSQTLVPKILLKKKRFFFSVPRKFYIHNGNKIIKKKLFNNKFPLILTVKTIKLYDSNSLKAKKKTLKKSSSKNIKTKKKKIKLVKVKKKVVLKKKENLKKSNLRVKMLRVLRNRSEKNLKKLITK